MSSKNASKLVFYYDDFYVLFLRMTQKTNAVRKILISDLESGSKNTSIKRKKLFIFGYVHKVKLAILYFSGVRGVERYEHASLAASLEKMLMPKNNYSMVLI